jgi:hypothetical protein
MKHDSEGRQFIAHHDVRGALVSASATLTGGTATSLVAGDEAYFLDLIELTLSNNSSSTASVALVQDGTTIRTFSVPAGSCLPLKFDVPVRQNTKGLPWNIDLEDITGTTIVADAVFIKKSP